MSAFQHFSFQRLASQPLNFSGGSLFSYFDVGRSALSVRRLLEFHLSTPQLLLNSRSASHGFDAIIGISAFRISVFSFQFSVFQLFVNEV
jgi:hypothetical protein